MGPLCKLWESLEAANKKQVKAKFMLENKSELLQKENKDLFGKEFHEKISEIVKDHKQSK